MKTKQSKLTSIPFSISFVKSIFNSLAAISMAILLFAGSDVYAAGKKIEKAPSNISIQKVSINRANAETLAAALNGVGIKKAKAIVAWRSANGKFKSVEQLQEVKGIGSAIIEKNKGVITL